MCNAGITDPVRRVSVDGWELHVATCHLAHFLLTHLLLDLLKKSAPARIVSISSDAHKAGPGLDFDDLNNEKIWKGARTHIYVASAPDIEGQSGKYFAYCKEAQPSPLALDPAIRRRIWAWTAQVTGVGG